MSMDRETLLALLPCYACGDLPPEVSDAVRDAVEGDPGLTELLEGIVCSRDACREALSRAAPLLDVEVRRRRLTRGPSPSPLGLVVGGAAAVALAVWGAAATDGGQALRELGAVHAAASGRAGFTSVATVSEARDVLIACGVPAGLAAVPDLSLLGLAVQGVQSAPGPRLGVVAVYELQGQTFTAQCFEELGLRAQAEELVSVNGRWLRVFQAEGISLVAWETRGLDCVLSGPMGPGQLLALLSAGPDGRR